MINESKVEGALKYLSESADDYAKWHGRRVYLKEHCKSVLDACFLDVEGGTVREREAKARNHVDYLAALKNYQEAESEAIKIKAWRDAADATIRVWQSQNATKRSANV